MRKRLITTMVLGTALAVACAGIATAYKPTVIKEGNLELILNGGFSPTKLPRKKLAPIQLNISGKINTLDGSRPPALKEVIVETDKNGTINAKGLPTCTLGKLKARETAAALKACKAALVGKGKTDVEVQFPESPPFIAHSKLLAFNGGVRGGKTTILIHAYLKNPVSAAVLTTVTVTKIHHGRYGTKSVAKVPLIVNGYGSPTSFELNFFRMFKYRGKTQSYLLAKCTDGKLKAHAVSIFREGPSMTGNFSRPCTPKG
ncbi:MAG: hypothetical protein ACM3N0_00760 [Chloroflexota bacterium]